MHHKLIYDSTEPFNLPPDVLCIAYVGGDFAWSEQAILRARAVYRMSETFDAANYMRVARAVGVEPGAASVDEAIKACRARKGHGHNDFTAYTSAVRGSNPAYQPGMSGMVQALRAHAPGCPFRLHVADWDGNPGNRPEAEGVQAWAKQYEGNVHGGAYDLSVLYGEDDLVRRWRAPVEVSQRRPPTPIRRYSGSAQRSR